MSASHYIHRTPYDGLVTTAHTADGIAWVDYQREPTMLADYMAAHPEMTAADPDAFERVLFDYYASRCTPAKRITPEAWQYALEVLPPCRWRNYDGIEVFHVSEHLDGPLVNWYARVGDACFEIVDVYNVAPEILVRKVKEAMVIPA